MDGADEVLGAAVGQVVAGDAGDHHVGQAHLPDRLGHAARLVGVHRPRPPLGHVAETAPPRANVTEDHEGGRLLGVALHAVGTLGMVADRLELELLDQPGREVVGVSLGNVALQPARQRLMRKGVVGGSFIGNRGLLWETSAAGQQGVAGMHVAPLATQGFRQMANDGRTDSSHSNRLAAFGYQTAHSGRLHRVGANQAK